jgi:parvulin-like peptidyl-prolyl isomerase
MRQFYRARHILLEDEEDALELYQELQDGADFAALAKEYSECESSEKGGDLGKFATGTMVAEFERALYHLAIDEVSKPVETKYGFHLIQRLAL